MPKSKWVSFFLCLFFGMLGAHKFYEGRILFGIFLHFHGRTCRRRRDNRPHNIAVQA